MITGHCTPATRTGLSDPAEHQHQLIGHLKSLDGRYVHIQQTREQLSDALHTPERHGGVSGGESDRHLGQLL